MLAVLSIFCLVISITSGILIFLYLLYSTGKRKIEIDKCFKIVLTICVISFILAFPLRSIEKKITETIKTEVSTFEISKDNCYMITSMEEHGENLFICEDKEGNLYYIWAKLEETQSNSVPYIEKTQFLPTKTEQFLTGLKNETYIIYSSSEYINYITNLKNVPFDKIN